MEWFTWVWLLLLVAVLAFEGFALASKRRGDTLSEHMWNLRDRAKKHNVLPLYYIVIIGVLGWMLLHFVLKI